MILQNILISQNIVYFDGYTKGLSATLCQIYRKRQQKVIAYATHSTTSAKQNYPKLILKLQPLILHVIVFTFSYWMNPHLKQQLISSHWCQYLLVITWNPPNRVNRIKVYLQGLQFILDHQPSESDYFSWHPKPLH